MHSALSAGAGGDKVQTGRSRAMIFVFFVKINQDQYIGDVRENSRVVHLDFEGTSEE